MILIFLLIGWKSLPLDLQIHTSIPITDKAPSEVFYVEEYEFLAGLYDTLVTSKSLGVQPWLAKRWSYNPDSLELTFELRKNAKFSDGSALSSGDVSKSYRSLAENDKQSSRLLTKCLPAIQKNQNRKSWIAENIFSRDNKVVIKTKGCSEILIADLADTPYGISVPFAKTSKRKISGPFTGRFENNETYLRPNPHHWIWKNDPPELQLHLKKMTALPNEGHFIFRTVDSKILKQAQQQSLPVSISLPTMAWFLSPDIDVSTAQTSQLFKQLNSLLRSKKIGFFDKNLLEPRKHNFFPKDFNCISTPPKSKPGGTPAIKKITLIEHKSSEDDIFARQILDLLNNSGYDVKMVSQASDAEKGRYKIFVRRMYFADSVLNVLTTMFDEFKYFADPQRKWSQRLLRAAKLPKQERSKEVKKLCSDFNETLYVPLSHRSIALITSHHKYLDVFSKVNGSFLIYRLPELLAK